MEAKITCFSACWAISLCLGLEKGRPRQLTRKRFDSNNNLRGKSAWPPVPWLFLKSSQVLLKEPLSPFEYDLPRKIESQTDFII